MTDIEILLNAWTGNPSKSVFCVQGEQQSRTLHVTLIDRTGENDAFSSAEKEPRYVNLTGYTARLYVVKGDGTKVYFPGTVTDAENGKVDFTLTGQCVTYPGKADCTLTLTKEDVELKVVGMTLDIQKNDLEDSLESTDEWVELDEVLKKAGETLTACSEATDGAKEAAEQAEEAAGRAAESAENADAKAAQADTAAQTAQEKATLADTAAGKAESAAEMANEAAARANAAAEAVEGTDVGDLALRVEKLEGQMGTVTEELDRINGEVI